MRKILLSILLCVSSIAGFAGESTGTPTSANFVASGINTTGNVLNPDRGLMLTSGTNFILPSSASGGFDSGSIVLTRSRGATMVYCVLDIGAYIHTTIPQTVLDQITANYALIRAAGLKCMNIVGYNIYNGSDSGELLSDIQRHTAQLSPIFHTNQDVIPYAKAGYIGAYAQWFGAQAGQLTCGYLTTITCPDTTVFNNMSAALRAIIDSYGPYTQIGVPEASFIPWIYPTVLSPSGYFSGSYQARTGFEDDCPLTTGGGNQDSGIYLASGMSNLSQAQIRTYMDTISLNYSAMFGEISSSCTPQQLDCPTAISYLSEIHASGFKMLDATPWIGSSFIPVVGSDSAGSWEQGGCAYRILNNYGYSMQLDSVTHQSTANRGDNITVTVKLRNIGWSRMWSPRTVTVNACLVAAPNTCYTGVADSDLRQLPPNATTSSSVQAHITIPVGATTGAYQIRLSIPDIWPTTQSRAFMVQFINSNSGSQTWNDAGGYMTTGTTLTVN